MKFLLHEAFCLLLLDNFCTSERRLSDGSQNVFNSVPHNSGTLIGQLSKSFLCPSTWKNTTQLETEGPHDDQE